MELGMPEEDRVHPHPEHDPLSDLPDELPILPLRNTVLFPGVVIPITVARDKSIQLVRDAYNSPSKLIGVVAQNNSSVDSPTISDLYTVGTVAMILRLIRMPEGSVTIVIRGQSRFNIDRYITDEPYFQAYISPFPDDSPNEDEMRAMMLSLKQEAERIIELSPNIPTEANITLHNIDNLSFLINFITSNLNIEMEKKQAILETPQLLVKGQMVLEHLSRELHVLELNEEIQSKVKNDLDKQQRDYILRQQIKAIQDELGEKSLESEMEVLRKRAAEKIWPQHAQETFERELSKLYRYNQASPEYGVSLNYIDWLLDLPWQEYTRDRFNLKLARKILDEQHYGIEKVKERIIEYLAVIKLKADMKAPILCFYGPPGVGKTSLGKSIAEALGRSFVRISLGGVRDEAEIRGHRKTYIGAMPGRIIQGLKKAKTGNPVFMLDEIDKVGNDWRGDPGSALLEVLDPEQNNTFNDHYLELDYDLSTILFIATANSLDTIHPALRDRMEIVEINGYTMNEKIEIAKRHLLPRQLRDHGLKTTQLTVEESAIRALVEGYTRESGVRNLTQKIANICRSAAVRIVEHKEKHVQVNASNLTDFVGVPRFENEYYQRIDRPGVSIGLAWTPVGGEILFIETVLMQGSGRMSITGQLGDVMKESASVAYHFLKANADAFNIDPVVFQKWDIHIHVPAGAIPKDGPSAGTALLTAMASAFSQRLVREGIAMTGEITLRGKVLPVGGIKEKILAAARAGVHTVLLCRANEKDVSEIHPDLIEKLKIVYVENLSEVLGLALDTEVCSNPVDLHRYDLVETPKSPQPTLA
jgi:ATP-dependent Lon protease